MRGTMLLINNCVIFLKQLEHGFARWLEILTSFGDRCHDSDQKNEPNSWFIDDVVVSIHCGTIEDCNHYAHFRTCDSEHLRQYCHGDWLDFFVTQRDCQGFLNILANLSSPEDTACQWIGPLRHPRELIDPYVSFYNLLFDIH